jgi:predicted TIM-barrel fold metal-dependent hydrolase
MDREGVAAEVVYNGDPRAVGMFFQSSNQNYPMDACQAGVRAYHRWADEAFGGAKDRLLPIALIGHAPWRNIKEMLAELDWVADRGFIGISPPGYTAYPGQPPLFDKYWDPLWARCEERGLIVWIHAGYGEGQGDLGREVARLARQMEKMGGTTEELAKKLTTDVFNGELFFSAKPRRAMWNLMMGGVLDRFPKLKVTMAEVYADWLPPTLQYLDEEFDQNRAHLRAKRRPGEYWADNFMACLSFARKCEIIMRHDIGLETVGFGRDYPHGEGTWPNTKPWLRDVLAGVPLPEARMILSENFIRFAGLDRAKLDALGQRIGFSTGEIFDAGPAVDQTLIKHFDLRGDYLMPPEGEKRIGEIDAMFKEDLWRASADAA